MHRKSENKFPGGNFEAHRPAELSGKAVAFQSNGNFVYINTAGVKLLGAYTAEEIVGKPVLEFVHPDSQELVKKRIELLGEKKFVKLAKQRWVRLDGRVVDLEVTTEPTTYMGHPVAQLILEDATGSEQIEAAPEEGERSFRRVFEQSVDALFVHDDRGRIADCNAEACRSLGYSREELLALSVGDFATRLVTGDERRKGATLWRRLIAGEPGAAASVHEGEHRRKDGSTFPVEVRLGSVDYGRRRMILAAARDITGQKETEEALRESEERFRGAFENASAGVALVGLDNRYLRVNRALCEMLGYAEEELLSRKTFEITHPEDLENSRRRTAMLLAGEAEASSLEKRYVHEDGRTVWATTDVSLVRDPKGIPLHFVSHCQDITRRKQAEKDLRESEERFRTIFEQSAIGISIADPDRRFLETNAAYQRITGYSGEELFGKEIAALSHPDDVPTDEARNREVHEGDTDRYQREKRYIRKDGEMIWVRPTISAVRDADGEPQFLIGMVEDITEHKKAEETLRRQKEYLAALNETTLGLMDRLDSGDLLENILRRASELLETDHGFVSLLTPEEDLLELKAGTGSFSGLRGDRVATESGPTGRVLRGGEPLVVEGCSPWPGHRMSAEDSPCPIVGVPLRSGPRVVGVICLVYAENERDFGLEEVEALSRFAELASVVLDNARLYSSARQELKERKALERELAHRAFHDSLTGLPNRALLEDRLGRALSRSGRRGGQVAVLFLDLDNFKLVNDSLGHETGDELLVAVGRRLQGCLRTSDTAARLGGDEFVVLLDVDNGAAEASLVADRILGALRAPLVLRGREFVVNTSIGIALGGASDRAGDLLRNADLAMYQAKAKGKAHCEVFAPSMHDKALKRLQLEEDLRRAIEQDELRANYQPKVRLDTGEIAGMEALVRWEHPQRGLILPEEFIPVAEETGLIVPLGRWMLEEACRQAIRWQEQCPDGSHLVMGVNLSARQILQSGLIEEVAEILKETGLAPHNLNLEITESVIMGEAQTNAKILEGLKGLGVKLAIDDFGTGYSSLSYLSRFPVDSLKIDRSFVDGLEDNPENLTVVSSIVALAHALGMSVIAEGVETEEQLARLRELSCDQAQGYFFSEPLTKEKASELLEGDTSI